MVKVGQVVRIKSDGRKLLKTGECRWLNLETKQSFEADCSLPPHDVLDICGSRSSILYSKFGKLSIGSYFDFLGKTFIKVDAISAINDEGKLVEGFNKESVINRLEHAEFLFEEDVDES